MLLIKNILSILLIIITLFTEIYCKKVECVVTVNDSISCYDSVRTTIYFRTTESRNGMNGIISKLCTEMPECRLFGVYNTMCTFGSPCYSKCANYLTSHFRSEYPSLLYAETSSCEKHVFYKRYDYDENSSKFFSCFIFNGGNKSIGTCTFGNIKMYPKPNYL